jgi:hypothetical protein
MSQHYAHEIQLRRALRRFQPDPIPRSGGWRGLIAKLLGRSG